MLTADEFRRAALALPEAEERETWGHPTFRVRDRMFATLSDDGRVGGIKTIGEVPDRGPWGVGGRGSMRVWVLGLGRLR